MQVTFVVHVSLDAEIVANLAARQHRPSADIVAELAGDCECRLNDAVRFKDGVERVGVELIDDPALLPTRPAA